MQDVQLGSRGFFPIQSLTVPIFPCEAIADNFPFTGKLGKREKLTSKAQIRKGENKSLLLLLNPEEKNKVK